MSENGINILNTVKQMKIIYKDISLLLKTVDELIGKKYWNPGWEDQSTCFQKSTLNESQEWMPSEIFRFYKNKDDPYRLCFVSILIDDDPEGYYTIQEPLVTAGYFNYGKKEIDVNWSYWWHRLYGYTNHTKHDGSIAPFIEGKEPNKKISHAYLFDVGEGFGLPLTDIKTEEDIQSKIITPLLKLLKENK